MKANQAGAGVVSVGMERRGCIYASEGGGKNAAATPGLSTSEVEPSSSCNITRTLKEGRVFGQGKGEKTLLS